MQTLKYISLALIILLLVNCSKEGASNAASTGKGGSLARFTVVGNYLYMADNYTLNVYDVSNPSTPVFKSRQVVANVVETIFPFKDKLFIGAADGMYVYSLAIPDAPTKLGQARHVRSCDPVVANDSIAYFTLRGGTRCGPATSGLYIYDIRNIMLPVQKSLKELSNPFGLGLKDSVVFVCRGGEGLTAIDVNNPSVPRELYTLKNANYIDVIPYDDILICYVTNGLILYDLSDLNKLKQVGSMTY